MGKVIVKLLVAAMVVLLAVPAGALTYDMVTEGNLIGVIMGSLFGVTMSALAGFFLIFS